MKKRLIILIFAVVMLLCSATAVVGCGDDAPKVEYSLTVVDMDENPVSGITVSWQQKGKTKGSAKTDADGVAKTKLVDGVYTIALRGYKEGLTYDSISVTSDLHPTLQLVTQRIVYTAHVRDKNGANASGVTVTWSNDKGVAGTAATDADGKAECELDYGEYMVSVSNLPAGNVFNGNITATGKNPTAQIELTGGTAVTYSVLVRSEGGLKFKNTSVTVKSGDTPVERGTTNDEGIFEFSRQAGDYTATVLVVQEGYRVDKQAMLTATVTQSEIVLKSAVITAAAPDDKEYKIGDIIHDYEFTTPYEVDGKTITYSIADLLETKDAVVINNWGTNCTYCVQEMPAIDEMYQKLNDKIELLAISNYAPLDSDSTIVSYRERNGYTFPMMRDTNNFKTHFNLNNWPTTIIVDRYGAIAHIEVGGIPEEEVWERLVNRYIGDGYVQTFNPGADSSESARTEASKPDITLPADHYEKVAEAVNKFTPSADMYVVWSGETKNEMVWPFILKTEEGISDGAEVLCAGNSKKPTSLAAIYATVKMPLGKVFTFDYYAETEAGYDVFSAVWDGKPLWSVSDKSDDGWATCHLYAELDTDEHKLAFAYIKDNSTNVGLDNVYIRNVRFEDLSAIEEPVDMLRGAAYGVPKAGAIEFPHYAGVELAADGYYHVNLGSLENSEYAGRDSSPMLFANLTNVTNWANEVSINDLVNAVKEEDGEYLVDCRLTVNGVTRDYREDLLEYCSIATNSDIPGFIPVDRELHDLLVAFIAKASGTKTHAKMWLEVCYFFSHYGGGEFVGNPTMGLTKKTAIVITDGERVTADLTKPIAPFPSVIYTFTPEESAVYKIQSLLPSGTTQASQVWLFDDQTDAEHTLAVDDENRFVRNGVNQQNFSLLYYMTAGHKYYIKVAFLLQESGVFDFIITNEGQSATELVPCSSGDEFYINEKGQYVLAKAVKYVLDEDGYYRALNSDGTRGDYIYLDVGYPSRTWPNASLATLVQRKLYDSYAEEYLDYYYFDFRYTIAYFTYIKDGEELTDYSPKYDLTESGIDRDFKDYTDIFKTYVATAEDGLVKVDADLAALLNLLIETRVNMLIDSDGDRVLEYEEAVENEWLRFCWYNRVHDVNNP